MIEQNHEYFVSLEVAKLLKEEGFDWGCDKFYDCTNSDCVRYEEYSVPTLDVAQRWLREVKNTHIEISPSSDMSAYIYNILLSKDKFWLGSPISYITYEEAQEAGIKKALEIILEKQ